MYKLVTWIDKHTEFIFVFNTFITLCAYFIFTVGYIFPLIAKGNKFIEPEWAGYFNNIGQMFFSTSVVYIIIMFGKWFTFRRLGKMSLIIIASFILVNCIYIFSSMPPDLYYGIYCLILFAIFVGNTIWTVINHNHN